MEALVGALIELDKKARQTLDAKKEFRTAERTRISGEERALYDSYVEKAKEKIEKVQKDSEAEAEKQLLKAQADYEAALKDLHTHYDENEERWLSEIVSACTEQ